MKSTTNKFVSLGWVVIIFGLIGAIALAVPITKDLSLYRWNQTGAKVVSTQIVRTEDHTSIGAWVYDPVITYQYTVAGKTYSSNSLSVYQDGSNDESVTQSIINKYPINGTIEIYYNPNNPAEAYIEHAESWLDFAFEGTLALLVVGGILLIRHGRK